MIGIFVGDLASFCLNFALFIPFRFRYHRRYDSLVNGRPTYQHSSGKYFLYYSDRSQGFWAVGEQMGSEVVRLENQGDRMCPYYLKSVWRYADGDLNALGQEK